MNILVIGELCKDKFIYGDVNRICPEAPVPVINPVYTVENDGMAGNVVKNLKAIYTDVKIDFWHQKTDIVKTRLVDRKSNNMIVRVDDEGDIDTLGYIDENKIDVIKRSDLVIVSDYNKGFLTEGDLVTISRYAKLSMLDSKKILSREIIESFSFVKINEKENNQNKDLSSYPNVIITMGDKGAKIGSKLFIQDSPLETIDVSGAGDTFISSFGIKYFQTKNIEESIMFANKMAAIVVGKRGVSTP
jgi:D-beta-D-heptose 7-phosphate kinase/D-beta-D-heptose 1-phosphate adenosyltransferase